MRKTIILSSIMSIFLTTTVLAAGWEQREDGTWIWRNNNGELICKEWRTASDGIDYFLGSDGTMVTNRMIEYDGNMYYVDEQGRKATEQWVSLYDPESNMDRWYYFQRSGKMYVPKERGEKKDIGGEKYIFDDEGRMLYGWIDEDGYMVDLVEEPDGWKTAMYYGGEATEGNLKTGWREIKVNYYDGKPKNEEEENDPNEAYKNRIKTAWFYFNNSGRKLTNRTDFTLTDEKGNVYEYKFDEYGVMTNQKLKNPPQTTTKTTTTTKKTPPKKKVDYSKWTERVPSKSENAYYNEIEAKQHFYTRKDGTSAKNVIEKIDGKYYCFDSAGIMKVGILAVKNNQYAYTLQNSLPWDDIWADEDELRQAMDQGYDIMYFDEETGARKTGKFKMELNIGKATLCFDSNGLAVDGEYQGYLYSAGVLQIAYDEYDSFTVNGKTYTVNEKGKIISNK